MQSQKQQNDLGLFPRQNFQVTVIRVYAPTTDAKEVEDDQFCESLQHFLELTPGKKKCPFHQGDWKTKVGSQEIPGIIGKFDLGVQNEARQRITEFSQENMLVIANNNTRDDSTHGHHQMVSTEIRQITFLEAEDGETL